MKYSPYSFSKIQTFEQCPLKFKYRYIDHIPVPDDKTLPLERGIFLHLMMEYQGDLNKVKENSEYKSLTLLNEEIENELINIYNNFKKTKVYDYLHTIDIVGNEIPIGLTKTLENTTYSDPDALFRGKVDYVGIDKKRDLLVISDWKSGAFRSRQNYEQLMYYSIYFFNEIPYDKILIIYSYLEQFKTNKVILERKNLEKYKKVLLKNIIKVEKEKSFEKIESNLCRYCPYFKICSES